jgi:PBP1b-binding outer membrane lipoprotein LpoB
MVKTRIAFVLFTALVLVSCSKKEPVKTAEQQKAEMDQAAKTTRDNTVWGDQVKALDKAKDVAAAAADATKKTDDALKKAD